MADALAIETDLEALEEMEGPRQPACCGPRNRGFGSSVPINLTHSHVAREKKPPVPVAAPPVVAPPEKSQPADVVLIKGNTRHFEPFRIVEDYEALCDALAERVEDLQATRLGIDAAGRFAGGHASCLLCKPQIKNYGPVSLTKMLEATGLVIVLAIDDERFAKVKERLGRRERPFRSPARKQSAP
jgi:hypothetical protein